MERNFADIGDSAGRAESSDSGAKSITIVASNTSATTFALKLRRNELQKKIALAQQRKQRLQRTKTALEKEQADESSNGGMSSIDMAQETETSNSCPTPRSRFSENLVKKVEDVTTASSLEEATLQDLIERKKALEQKGQLEHFQRLLSKQEALMSRQSAEIAITDDKICKLNSELGDIQLKLDAIPAKLKDLQSREVVVKGLLDRNKAEMDVFYSQHESK